MASASFNLLRLGAHSSPTEKRCWRRPDPLACLRWGSRPCNSFKVYCSAKEQQVHLETYLTINRIEELKQRVRTKLSGGSNPMMIMTLIDTIQRLGIKYHFDDEISRLLDQLYDVKGGDNNLFITALHFRLLRQDGYSVATEVFHKFMDSKGRFKEVLGNDLQGLLSLHEASYTGAEGEDVLSQAMVFSKQQLETLMLRLSPGEVRDITLALDSPMQWRTTRFGARNFIEKYGQEYGRSSELFELARLDFNFVQSLYQQETTELINWWRKLDLTSNLSFARDRPIECYLWSMGIFPEPHFSRCRIELSKAIAILLVVDDVYDNYAPLDELIVFTDAIRRWDIDAIEKLPEYMKICYMALYNTTNDIGYMILKEHGCYVVPHLAKTWINICEAFLTEARWFNSEVVPNLENYLCNGVTSAGTHMALVYAYYLMGNQSNTEASTIVNGCPKLFTSAGRILRLWDDLGTSKAEQERGDVASSIQCYMKENGSSSEDDARRHVKWLIHKAWQDLNGESLVGCPPLSRSIIETSLNVARTAQSMYQHGDNEQYPSVNDHIQSLLQRPIHHKVKEEQNDYNYDKVSRR